VQVRDVLDASGNVVGPGLLQRRAATSPAANVPGVERLDAVSHERIPSHNECILSRTSRYWSMFVTLDTLAEFLVMMLIVCQLGTESVFCCSRILRSQATKPRLPRSRYGFVFCAYREPACSYQHSNVLMAMEEIKATTHTHATMRLTPAFTSCLTSKRDCLPETLV
jgi:hypothetical protein